MRCMPPASLWMVIEPILKIASFDLIDTDELNSELYNVTVTEPEHFNFEVAGFEQTGFI